MAYWISPARGTGLGQCGIRRVARVVQLAVEPGGTRRAVCPAGLVLERPRPARLRHRGARRAAEADRTDLPRQRRAVAAEVAGGAHNGRGRQAVGGAGLAGGTAPTTNSSGIRTLRC